MEGIVNKEEYLVIYSECLEKYIDDEGLQYNFAAEQIGYPMFAEESAKSALKYIKEEYPDAKLMKVSIITTIKTEDWK